MSNRKHSKYIRNKVRDEIGSVVYYFSVLPNIFGVHGLLINCNFSFQIVGDMARQCDIETLSSGRRLLKLLHLHNRHKSHSEILKSFDFIVYAWLWLPSVYVALTMFWHFFDVNTFGKISLTMATEIMTISLILSFATLATNITTISTTFDQLQDFVAKRKRTIHLFIPFPIF